MTRPTIHRHTTLQALDRRMSHLEGLLADAGICPQTIEQCVMACLRRCPSGGPVEVVAFAEKHYGLRFKAPSVSAIMCKLVRMGIIRKSSRPGRGYHQYKLKGSHHGTR